MIQFERRWVNDEYRAGEFITKCLLAGGSWKFDIEALYKDDKCEVKDGFIVEATPACQSNWGKEK